MTDTGSTAFLSGQGIPVAVPEIESELARLWGPAAEREGGPDLDHPNVTRIALANLVVAGLGVDPSRLEPVFETVVTRHPCRAIVLGRSDAPGRAVEAEVSAVCRLPAPGLPQVCSERIVLRAGVEGLDLLPGAVRPLLEAGLPVVLWWADDPRSAPSLFRELAAEATRSILDLPDPDGEPEAVRLALDPAIAPFGRDLSWFGITPWRELVAQLFDPIGSEAELSALVEVEVRVSAPSTGPVPRVSAWLAAWLAGRLGWWPHVRQVEGDRLAASFRGPSGEIAVSILTDPAPDSTSAQVSGVTLTTRGSSGEGTYRLERPSPDSDSVRVEVQAPQSCILPRLVRAPEFDAARRVSAALESARDDPPYRQALPIMLWLLDGR